RPARDLALGAAVRPAVLLPGADHVGGVRGVVGDPGFDLGAAVVEGGAVPAYQAAGEGVALGDPDGRTGRNGRAGSGQDKDAGSANAQSNPLLAPPPLLVRLRRTTYR